MQHYHSFLIIRRSVRWLISATALFIAILCLLAASSSGFTPAYVVIIACCSFFAFGWPFLDRLGIMWRYRHNPEQFVETTVTIAPDVIALSNQNMDLRLPWHQLRSILDTPRGLLFVYPPHRPLFWLPNRLFEGNVYKHTIFDLATRNCVPIRRVI